MDRMVHIGPIRLKRKRAFRWGALLCMLLVFLLFRGKVLRLIGNYLIVEDELEQVDAIFVLSGNSFDRGREAARLYHEGYGDRLVCLGGETNSALELFDIDVLTAVMTEKVLLEAGVPAAAIELLPKGTSTFEEFEAIIDYCQARGHEKIMVVSSLFHTRRIHEFFRLRLYFAGIQMVLRGAPESSFEEDHWWAAEPGLLFVNNEYVKLLYYWMRY